MAEKTTSIRFRVRRRWNWEMADVDGDGIESRMHTNSSKCVWLKMLLFVVDIIRNSKRKENVRSQHTSASTSHMNYTFDWVNNQIQCKTRFTFFFVAHTLSLSLTAKFQSKIHSNRIRFLCFFFHQMWIFNLFSKILPLYGSDCWQSIYVHSRMRSKILVWNKFLVQPGTIVVCAFYRVVLDSNRSDFNYELFSHGPTWSRLQILNSELICYSFWGFACINIDYVPNVGWTSLTLVLPNDQFRFIYSIFIVAITSLLCCVNQNSSRNKQTQFC